MRVFKKLFLGFLIIVVSIVLVSCDSFMQKEIKDKKELSTLISKFQTRFEVIGKSYVSVNPGEYVVFKYSENYDSYDKRVIQSTTKNYNEITYLNIEGNNPEHFYYKNDGNYIFENNIDQAYSYNNTFKTHMLNSKYYYYNNSELEEKKETGDLDFDESINYNNILRRVVSYQLESPYQAISDIIFHNDLFGVDLSPLLKVYQSLTNSDKYIYKFNLNTKALNKIIESSNMENREIEVKEIDVFFELIVVKDLIREMTFDAYLDAKDEGITNVGDYTASFKVVNKKPTDDTEYKGYEIASSNKSIDSLLPYYHGKSNWT